jgi:hypothetical protein
LRLPFFLTIQRRTKISIWRTTLVSEEGDLDIENEPRRDGFQELCLVLKFGFFSFVRFDAKGWQ